MPRSTGLNGAGSIATPARAAIASAAARRERSQDAERPVDELRLGREHGGPHRLAGGAAQDQGGFQRGGGGVAAVESVLALRALAGGRVEVELLARAGDFVHRPFVGTDAVQRHAGAEPPAGPSGRFATRAGWPAP
jgi:hypothetical protein